MNIKNRSSKKVKKSGVLKILRIALNKSKNIPINKPNIKNTIKICSWEKAYILSPLFKNFSNKTEKHFSLSNLNLNKQDLICFRPR